MSWLFVLQIVAAAIEIAPEDRDVYDRMMAYERLFDHVELVFELRPTWEDLNGGEVPREEKPPKPETYYADGDRKRLDREGVVRRTDGKTVSTWRRRTDGRHGTAMVEKHTDKLFHGWPLEYVNPFAYFAENNDTGTPKAVRLEVAEQSDAGAVVRLHFNPYKYYEFHYESVGEYLRPLEIWSHYAPPNRPPGDKIIRRYHYGTDAEGRPLLHPLAVERIVNGHVIQGRMNFTRVEFSPQWEEDPFAFKYDEGTDVYDAVAGTTTNYGPERLSPGDLERVLAEQTPPTQQPPDPPAKQQPPSQTVPPAVNQQPPWALISMIAGVVCLAIIGFAAIKHAGRKSRQ